MNRYTFDDVGKLDNDIYQLALYEVTKGKLALPKGMEQLAIIQEKIAQRFNYYKMVIRSGECTIEFIRHTVFAKYGPFPEETSNPDGELNYDDITRYVREEDDREIRTGRLSNLCESPEDVLNSLRNLFRIIPDNFEELEDIEDIEDDFPFDIPEAEDGDYEDFRPNFDEPCDGDE